MAAEPAPPGEQQALPGAQQASGPRSVAASRISGTVVTGDGAWIDARAPVLGVGLPRPADVTVATGLHNLPRPPASVFVGRTDVLSRLERSLSAGSSVVVTQAVFGLGGVGKSELALQHAHVHRHRYPLTWWITADEPRKVEAGLATLAGRICPDIALTATTAEAAAWALTWLQAHPGWLLILDDVSDPADVEPLLGQLHGGHILLTTRRDAGWRRIAAPMRLDLLAPGPAAALITSAIEQPSPDDKRTAAEIAAELGFLPLALDQAAAYIAQARIPLPRYLELLFLRALAPHGEAAASRYRPGEEGGILARVLNEIALFYQSQGAYQVALRLRTVCLSVAVRIFGDDHEATSIYLGNLAATYGALGRHGEALPLEVRALAVTEAALGPDHPNTVLCRGNLAACYRAVGRDADAMALESRRGGSAGG